jgi:hypothetical protein
MTLIMKNFATRCTRHVLEEERADAAWSNEVMPLKRLFTLHDDAPAVLLRAV